MSIEKGQPGNLHKLGSGKNDLRLADHAQIHLRAALSRWPILESPTTVTIQGYFSLVWVHSTHWYWQASGVFLRKSIENVHWVCLLSPIVLYIRYDFVIQGRISYHET